MLNLVVNALLSTLCFFIAICGLLTDRMKIKYYLGIIGISFLGVFVGAIVNLGQVVSIFVLAVSLILIWVGERVHPIFNIIMACLGYMFIIWANELTMLIFNKCLHITTELIVTKYYILFSLFYAGVEFILIMILRVIVYRIIKIETFFGKGSKLKYGVLAESIGFVAIFLVNIILGEKAGYSTTVLVMNCILFGICFIISSIVLGYCTRQIQIAEQQKMDETKMTMTKKYIEGLECMIDESREIRHDYKNVLSTLAGYLQEEDFAGLKVYYEENIRDFWVKSDQQGKIWNSLKEISPMALKGFLYEKVLKAVSKQIDFRIVSEKDISLEDKDMQNLIRMFGNILDNAVEAAAESSERKVELRLTSSPSGFYFIVRNTFLKKPEIGLIFEKGYTTKGEGHGNGLYEVREYLKKREDIFFDFSVEENWFIQHVEIVQRK